MDDEPILYKNKPAKARHADSSQINGGIVFWFIISALICIFSLFSFTGNATSGQNYSGTTTALIAAALTIVYSGITIILTAARIGRLFIAISHIVASILSVILCIVCFVALTQINTLHGYYAYDIVEYAKTIYTVAAGVYLAVFCFYMIYGLYFLSGVGAKKWFGDYAQNRHPERRYVEEVEYRVPSKSKQAQSVKIRCANCDAEITIGMKFCPECGTELDWDD